MTYTPTEIMAVAAARELNDGETMFVGTGTPMLTCTLAKATEAPNATLVYEPGVVGAGIPVGGVPVRVGDPKIAHRAELIYPQYENFSRMLSGGRVDVGVLGGAQIDKYGNINSSVLGSYDHPEKRFPGSGGACEIACNAKRVLIMVPHERRRFPERVDFITSPGHLDADTTRADIGLKGGGPAAVVTDKAVMRFDDNGELYVDQLHPGVTPGDIQDNTGWEIPIPERVTTTPEPSPEILRIIREDLDPDRQYTSYSDDAT